MVKPTWFSESNYIADKLAQLTALGYVGATTESVTTALAEVGGAWNHYLGWGYKESAPQNNVVTYLNLKDASGNVVFNTQLYCEAKLATLQLNPEYAGLYSSWQEVADMFIASNISPYQHFVAYGAQEGLSISSTFNANNYFVAKLQSLVKADPATYTSWNTAQVAKYFADNGIDPYQHFLTYGSAEGITAAMVAPTGGMGGQTYDLTVGQDNLIGTSGNDVFLGYAFDDQNTLQSGDRIDGGAGRDTLEADLFSNANNNTVTPITNNVEVVKFNARDQATGGGNNFTQARVDAERMHGVEQFWSTKSRADVSIEDVVTDSNKMTSVFQSSDPGAVDFSVFFNSQNLKSDASVTTGTLNLLLIDGKNAVAGDPLTDNVYNTVIFHLDGKQHTLKFDLVNGADATYAQLAAAMQKAIDADPALKAAGVTATVGTKFEVTNADGATVSGEYITLTSPTGAIEALNGTGDGWLPSVPVPPTSNLTTGVVSGTTGSCPLIVTNIGLDNVGSIQWDDASPDCLPDNALFGSRSGNMVVGGMGARDGVQSFLITADRGSWLNSLSSTNNQLRSITLNSGDLNGDGVAGISATKGGQVFIGAHGGEFSSIGNIAWQDSGRLLNFNTNVTVPNPGGGGTITVTSPVGIWDVKEFNATSYTGNINIAAQFTADSYAKYLADVDGLDTVYGKYAPEGEFKYTFGTGDDTLNMKVNGGLAADRDFIFSMEMGEGNDFVNYAFDFQTVNQVTNQAGSFVRGTDNGVYSGTDNNGLVNVTIDTGAGDDVVKTWGSYTLSDGNTSALFEASAIKDQANNDFDGVYGAVKVNTGAGKNVVYAAQQQSIDIAPGAPVPPAAATDINNAIWVLNANSANAGDTAVLWNPALGSQADENNVASTKTSWTSNAGLTNSTQYTVKTIINFMGISIEANVGQYSTTATGTTFDIPAADMNDAIMKAINGHDVLSKLLLVKDGAGNSLLIESLIVGQYGDNLSIGFQQKVSTAADSTYANITTTDYSSVGSWHGAAADDTTGQDHHFYGFTDITGGADDDLLVTGYADAYVKAGAGKDTIIVGNETYNKITGDAGADNIFLGKIATQQGNSVASQANAYDAVYQAKGDSGTFTAPATTATSVATATFDVIHNFDSTLAASNFVSDHLYIAGYKTGTLLTAGGAAVADFAALGATANDAANWLQGSYNAVTGQFTAGAGTDALVVYDSTAGTGKTLEAVVLTGVADGATSNTLGFTDTATEGYLTFTTI